MNRINFIKLLKKANKTHDGIYWFPQTIYIIKSIKDENTSYFYKTSCFENNIYWTSMDIKLFLSNNDLNYDIISYMYFKKRFYDISKDLLNNDIYFNVPGKLYNISELVDNYFYKYNI